jgi:hypothetical protein
MINELFQDAVDRHGFKGQGYIAPLGDAVHRVMAQVWRSTDAGARLRTLDKYQLLLSVSGRQTLDAGTHPYQDAHLVISVRNKIIHFQPEYREQGSPHAMTAKLQGKFSDNRLMNGSENPWWPDHCLGAGCAQWAHTSVKALADAVVGDLDLYPNYRRLEDSGFYGRRTRVSASDPASAWYL